MFGKNILLVLVLLMVLIAGCVQTEQPKDSQTKPGVNIGQPSENESVSVPEIQEEPKDDIPPPFPE